MKHAKTLSQQDIVLKKEPRSCKILRTIVDDILEEQQQIMLISDKERGSFKKSDQETQQQQHTLQNELKDKAKIVDLGCQKARARKADNVHSNMTRQRKEKAKGIDQEAWLKKRQVSRTTTVPKNKGNVHREKKIVLRVSTAKEEIAVTIEIVIIGIHRIANTSRNISVKWERIVHSCTHRKRSTSPKDNGKGKESQKKSNGCNYIFCKSPSEDNVRQALAIRNVHEHLLAEKKSIRFSHQSLERAKFREKCPSLNVTQTASKNRRSPNAPPCDQRCTVWIAEQDEFARHRAHKLHKTLSTKQTSPEVSSLQRRRIPRQAW